MIINIYSFNGTTSVVYKMDKGEKIRNHKHSFVHSTGVISGSTLLTVDGDYPLSMKEGDNRNLPANIFHEIEATSDVTIVINMQEGEYVPPATGGILMADGTVVKT